MKTLYIDNNILNLERYWSLISALLTSNPQLRLVISDWNMVELASGTDRAQAVKRARFVDSLKPLWMHGSLPIQRQEVRRFTWQHYYGVVAEGVSIFAEHLSEVWSVYVGAQTVIGLNATKWVEIVGDLSAITSAKPEQIEVLKTLQAASAEAKEEKREEVFVRWVLARVSDRGPDGKLITRSMKRDIANFCWDNRKELYSSSPAMAVESVLHTIRSRDPTRQPKGSDAIDLHHGILALSHCDYYVTRDGFARHCAIYAKRALADLRTAELYESVDDLARSLSKA